MSSPHNYLAVIKVVGIGGGGVNAVNRMIDEGLKGVEFIAVNTDAQALLMSDGRQTRRGPRAHRGLGAGADGGHEGRGSKDEIEEVLKGPTWCSSPPVRGWHWHRRRARRGGDRPEARGRPSVWSPPVLVRGRASRGQADAGIDLLREACDTLIVIPNDRLLQLGDAGVSMMEAFGRPTRSCSTVSGHQASSPRPA